MLCALVSQDSSREGMENLTAAEIAKSAFHWFPHNSSYVLPGFYDIEVGDATWIIAAALMFFSMQTGLALVEAGTIRDKNKINVMTKNIVDFCASGMGFWVFGFGLMFGRGEYSNPFFGAGDFFLNVKAGDPLAAQVFTLYIFQLGFATTSTTIMSGAVSERFRFPTYILFSFVSMFLYAVGAGWVWGEHGFLRNIGVLDFAGAGPVHIIGGGAGFVAAWYVGPRIGRFDKGPDNPFPAGDPKNMIMGCFILWWGWVAFNSGSSYGVSNGKWELGARAGAGTVLASMGAGSTTLVLSTVKHKGKADAFECVSGVISALVAINAGCYMFSMQNSFLTGVISALLCFFTAPLVDRMGIDDAVGTTSVNYVNGVWGHISVGLFADPISGPKGLFINGHWYQLTVQIISATCLSIWAGLAGLLMMWLIDKITPIRLTSEDEITGCDYTEHFDRDKREEKIDCNDECLCYETQKPLSALDQIICISSQVARRFSGGASPIINRKQFRDFSRRFSLNVPAYRGKLD